MSSALQNLPELTTPASDDLLYITDTSNSNASKKITRANLYPTAGGGGSILIASSTASSTITARADYVCDGTADNVQIQAAIDSLSQTLGGTVELSEGQFNLAVPLTVAVQKGFHLRGQGYGSILYVNSSVNDYAIKFNTTDQGIWAKFSDLKIDGNCTGQNAGGGIYAPGSLECIFDGLWFHQCYDWGMYLYSISESPLNYGHNNRIINCVFDNGQNSSGIGGGILMLHNDENHIHNNDFQFMGGAADQTALGDGYCIKDAAGLNTITANAFVNSYNGVVVRDAGNTLISGNIFDRARVISCMLRGRQNTVRDNVFYQMGSNSSTTNVAIGLYIEYYNSCSVEGNWFISDGTNGVTRSFIKDNSDATGGGDHQLTDNYFYVDGTLGTSILELSGNPKRNTYNSNRGNTLFPVVTKTANYTALVLDSTILVDATAGAVTVTLPKAETAFTELKVVKIDASVNAVAVTRTGSDTILGTTSVSLSSQYDSAVISSNGVSAWY